MNAPLILVSMKIMPYFSLLRQIQSIYGDLLRHYGLDLHGNFNPRATGPSTGIWTRAKMLPAFNGTSRSSMTKAEQVSMNVPPVTLVSNRA
jgi:hypothetical protein